MTNGYPRQLTASFHIFLNKFEKSNLELTFILYVQHNKRYFILEI